jgi:hypothetical protein
MCLIIADVARQTKEGDASQWGHTDARLVATPNNEVRCDLSIVGSAQQGDLWSGASPIPPQIMSITVKLQDEPTQTPQPSGDLKGAQPWGHRLQLEMQVSQAAQSHTIHSGFKTISLYLFPLKSWLALNPVDWNHIGP